MTDLREIFGEGLGKYASLREAALTTRDFPVLLRDGIKSIMFDAYGRQPQTWQDICLRETSNKEQESYAELAHAGSLPRVGEGTQYPKSRTSQLPQINIRNYKYGDIIPITEEMIKFDKTGLIRQLAADQGERAAQTIEEAVYDVLFTTGNYTRTTTDNDIGNNTNATVFSAAGFELAYSTLAQMKDSRSGRYYNITPDTLIIGPRLQWAAQQLFKSQGIQWGGGATTNADYGAGNVNPMYGAVKRIIVSPQVTRAGGAFMWVLLQAKKAMVYQEVEPLQIAVQGLERIEDEGRFNYDEIRYRVRAWFGTGMLNDRFAYLGAGTTKAVIG